MGTAPRHILLLVIGTVALGGCKLGRKMVEAYPPRGADGDVIFATGFESSRWYWDLGADRSGGTTKTVSADEANGFEPLDGRALRVTIPEGEHAGAENLSFFFDAHTGAEPEEIYFRYYLRLADDWDTASGGKLPGVAGTYGRGGWGGRQSDGRNGWSARGLFHEAEGNRVPVGFYCYHADMETHVGSNWLWTNHDRGLLERNRWYCIEQHVRLNTPGRNDGVLRAWVDGKLAFKRKDVRFRDTDELKIERVWLNVYHGGKATAQRDHHLFIDEVVVSRSYVGPRSTGLSAP